MSQRDNILKRKDPDSDEPFGWDWEDYLLELGVGVVIATSDWTITGPDVLLTQHDDTVNAGNLSTKVFLAAGTPGRVYTVTNRIITNSSPPVTDERSFDVLVQDR